MRYKVQMGNWTNYVKDNDNPNSTESNELFIIGNKGKDPARGCSKSFIASYSCGKGPMKEVVVPESSYGKTARLDCNNENQYCNSYRLTLTVDGNLTYTRGEEVIWESSTSKQG